MTPPVRCEVCQDRGWLAYDVPPGDPRFGKLAPCSCSAASKLAQARQLFAGPHYAEMTFDSYKPLTSLERAALRVARSTVRRWQVGEPASLVLYAPETDELRVFPGHAQALAVTGSGNGKTHLAVAMARAALDLGRDLHLETEPDLLKRVRESYGPRGGPSQEAILADITGRWLVALDDIGAGYFREESIGWYQDIMFQIVDHHYTAQRPVILTSNLDTEGLKARLGVRVFSRLEQMGGFAQLDGPDRRAIR